MPYLFSLFILLYENIKSSCVFSWSLNCLDIFSCLNCIFYLHMVNDNNSLHDLIQFLQYYTSFLAHVNQGYDRNSARHSLTHLLENLYLKTDTKVSSLLETTSHMAVLSRMYSVCRHAHSAFCLWTDILISPHYLHKHTFSNFTYHILL